MYNVWYGGTLTSLVLRVCCITAVPPLIGMSGATFVLYYSCTSLIGMSGAMCMLYYSCTSLACQCKSRFDEKSVVFYLREQC